MSEKPCEVSMKMQIRSQRRRLPRWSANLWSNKVTSRLCETEPVLETSSALSISKRRYGMETKGSFSPVMREMKSKHSSCECLWLLGYKSSTFVEGARSGKMAGQIHKACHPLGCSGNLNPTVTVHPVNVGTSCFG